jgi:uncharacterized membrane protein (UPF0127 family)
MRKVQIINTTTALEEPLEAVYCDSFFCRLKGLMFRSRLPKGQGVLLVEEKEDRLNTSIHMFFVFMDLAIIWIDSAGQVVDTILARSWHPLYVPSSPARYVLEVHPLRLADFRVGDHLEMP